MRAITLGKPSGDDIREKLRWIYDALAIIERASKDVDPELDGFQAAHDNLDEIVALTLDPFGLGFLELTGEASARGYMAAAPAGAKYIVQTADAELTGEQALGALASGIVKNTTGTGVLSIAAAGTDYKAASLTGSATYDPPNLAAGATTTTTVTVTGAVAGNRAVAAFSLPLQGIMITAEISGADTATVVFFNPTAGAIDIASGTLSVEVLK